MIVCVTELIDTIDDCDKLQQDIDKLGAWARKWGMRSNPFNAI